jgi:imidazolonepropionase-like amidohydrolase
LAALPFPREDEFGSVRRTGGHQGAVLALTLELQRAGVLLLLGSDASTPGLYPGWSAILELEELVGAGLTPFEALSTGTRNAGEFLARNVPGARPIGTIEAGKAADLVLVEGNPLEDVSVMRDPAGVVLGGRWFPREDLESRRSAAP